MGEVLRYPSVLTVDVSARTVTVSSPTTSYTSIGSTSDFVISALDYQFDETAFLFFQTPKADISESNITITNDIDLSGTGITGLTRDNDVSSDGSGTKCIYKGIINGSGKTITLAVGEPYGNGITSHDKEGRGKIYRHAYNGLVGIAHNSTFSNIKFAGKVDVCAKGTVYIGTAAAQAKGTFNASGCETVAYVSQPESGLLMTISGDNIAYGGRLVGYCTKAIGDISISSSIFDGKLTGANSSGNSCFGGVIGTIAHETDEKLDWTFTSVTLRGEVSNTYAKVQRIGGLISSISGYSSQNDKRDLTLDRVTIDGLAVNGRVNNNSLGGLLGYSWFNTNVNVKSVTLSNNPTVSMNGTGYAAGLVFRATGHWIVTELNMTGINIVAPNAKSVGMIVNRGISHDDDKLYKDNTRSAIYLELLEDSYVLSWGTSTSLPASRSSYVFDELCAYTSTSHESIMRNGNGIISVSTSDLKMEKTAEDSLTYIAQTTEGQTANPNSRYYYNLDRVTAASSSSDIFTDNPSNQLMSWGVNQYASQNINNCFADCFSGTITNQTYDMKGYSWYPVSLDNSLTIQGSFTLYNQEFENCEAESDNAWSSRSTGSAATQHYMMQNGLLYDINGNKTLTVGVVSLSGNAGLTNDDSGSGMLVRGTVKGTSATAKATVTIDGPLKLDGAYISGISNITYAPLLINNVDSFTNLIVKNVATTNKYQSMNSSNYPGLYESFTYPKAGSSLIGNVGLSNTASSLTVEFSGIKLDGRTADVSVNTYNSELNSVYGTNRTVFTKATLLNQFMYESGSTGTYNYTWAEDWEFTESSCTHIGHGVTYGREVGYTDSDSSTEYPGKERMYVESSSGEYTNPISGTDQSGSYTGFNNFLPYVATGYVKANKTHQLQVNHSATVLTGCGTYNDPYKMTGADFSTVARIINGGTTGTIILPKVSSETSANLLAADWDNNGDALYKYDTETSKFRQYEMNGENIQYTGSGYDLDTVRQYLARAYYSLSSDIELESGFIGLGSNTNDSGTGKYYFRGVIIGNDYTITNKSDYPLINYSFGSVVKNVVINVRAESETISLSASSASKFPTFKAYGAVIGQVLGGDNIIDNVSVSFLNTQISLSGKYAQLIPVGGYVGVIEKGGVYFRGMQSKTSEEIQGLTSSVNSNVAENDTKWLYVNPIIGRVVNGFAVNEAGTYRPYENGKRQYNGDTTTETVTDSNGAVTMQNGNKHYSITDIDLSLAKLNTNNTDNVVEVPNGQAFFVMSLIVNSGMSNQSLGYNANDYQMSRWADYDEIGPDATTNGDYAVAHEDISQSNTTNKRRGYLMHKYTSGDTDISSSSSSVSIKLTTKDIQYILPDGYKGIGNIFQDNANYRMAVSTFDGNGATISQNTTYYYYPGYGTDSTTAVNLCLNGIDGTKMDANFDGYYHPYLVKSDDGRGGLGLFNYITNVDNTATFKNFTLKGNVETNIIQDRKSVV